MNIAYYSLTCDPAGTHERQWQRSIRSLRRHNQTVPVALCLYGPAGNSTLGVAEQCGVAVHQMGDYRAALGDRHH